MPINKYYGGHGDEVMSNMTKEYGDKKGKSVFYATANKRGAKPMAYGGMAIPDDPYQDEDQIDPRLRTQYAQAPPPMPSDIPNVPARPVTPPSDPDVSMARSGSLGTGDPAMQTAAATKAQTLTVDTQTQDNPSAGPPPEPQTQEDVAPGTVGDVPMAPVTNKYSVGPEQQYGNTPPPVPGVNKPMLAPKVHGTATQEALDYAKQMITDPKTGDFKKPAMWQNILGGFLGGTRLAGIDVHPNLTRQYQNYKVLTSRANLERQSEIAKALEQEKLAGVANRGERPLTGPAAQVQLLTESFLRTGKHEDGTPMDAEEARDAALDAWRHKTIETSELYRWIGQTKGADGQVYDRVMNNRTHQVITLPGVAGARPSIWGSTSVTTGTKTVETGNGVYEMPTTKTVTRTPGTDQQSVPQPPAAAPVPQAAPPVAPPAAAPNQGTLGARNNNPGNLMFAGQPGATQGEGGFARFPTPEAGQQALLAQIQLDSSRGMTFGQYIEKYAPKKAGNDTAAYIRNGVAALGIDPNTPLAQVDPQKLAAFQVKQEGGAPTTSSAPAQAAGAPATPQGPPGGKYLGPPKAAGKSTLMFVPDGKGGMTLTLMKPGDVAPDGSVSPGGMNQLNVPTLATRQMAEKAPRVLEFADRINNLLAENEQAYGPLNGRMNELMTGKIGLKGKDYVAIRTNMDLLSTALMQMHVGQRGGEHMLDHFGKLLGGAEQDPENIKTALAEITRYAGFVAQEGRKGGGGDSTPTRYANNPETGERLGLVNGKWVPVKK